MPPLEKRKRGEEEPGPSGTSKRRRSQDLNDSTSSTSSSTNNNNNNNNNNEDNFEISETSEDESKPGILQWITVKNFMCHDHLNFKFSPHVNFLQGRNGSGKSAILTAVVIGLGGQTRCTNRGSNIKDLVKHGKQVATIEIGIRNVGKYAYKPEVYGKTIIVERKIGLVGSSGYKLKASNGTVVATRKEDLMRMTDHFNMQVENPITMLNQDMARSFFNTTEPKLLFKLYLRATQLQQVKDDYAQLDRTIKTCMRTIECRKECLPGIAKEVEEQTMRYQFSLALREKGKKLADLRQELAWAKINEQENTKAQAEKALTAHQEVMRENEEKVTSLKEELENASERREQRQKWLQKATNKAKEVTKRLRETEGEMKTLKNEYQTKKCKVNVTEKKVRSVMSEITMLKAAIEKDNNRARSRWAAEQAEWQKKVDKAEEEMREVVEGMKAETTHYQNIQSSVDAKTEEKRELAMEEKALCRQLNELEKELKGLQSQKGSQLTVYGQWVPQLLEKIDAAAAKGMFFKKPVGPLGAFVNVKDNRWAHVAERVLGRRVTSFCIDNQADEEVFRRLVKEVKFDHQQQIPIVTVAKFREKVHDVSRYEVRSPDYPSLWSVLDISSTVVANAVIDLMQVESILLIPTAKEAGRLLKDAALVPPNCKCAYTLNLDQYYPDPNYRLYSGKGSHRAKFLQVSVEDRVNEVVANKADCMERITALSQQQTLVRKETETLMREVSASNKKSNVSKKKLDGLRMTLANLKNQETLPPPDVAHLQEEIKQQEESLKAAKSEMQEHQEDMLANKAKYEELLEAVKVMKEEEKEEHKNVEEHKQLLDLINSNVTQSQLKTCQSLVKQLKREEKDLRKEVKESTENLETALRTLEEFNISERIVTKKSVKELERQYTTLQARLNKERAYSGDPVVVGEKYKNTKNKYKQLSEDLNKHAVLLKKLSECMHQRDTGYNRLHNWLTVIVKYFFKEHLSLRNLEGSIHISLEEETLNIRVRKPGVAEDIPLVKNTKIRGRKSNAHQELTMMSGGERSFVTVCFIIGLWHGIVSPVRILDEFDVFMDVIGRNRAMKMMIEAAKPDTQYIFLTPLSLYSNKFSNCVFFKMPDPEKSEEDAVESSRAQTNT